MRVRSKRAEPDTKIVEERPEMRRDTAELVRKAGGRTGEPRRLHDELPQIRSARRVQREAFDLPAVTTVSARTAEPRGEAARNTARNALLSALTLNTPPTRVPLSPHHFCCDAWGGNAWGTLAMRRATAIDITGRGHDAEGETM